MYKPTLRHDIEMHERYRRLFHRFVVGQEWGTVAFIDVPHAFNTFDVCKQSFEDYVDGFVRECARKHYLQVTAHIRKAIGGCLLTELWVTYVFGNGQRLTLCY